MSEYAWIVHKLCNYKKSEKTEITKNLKKKKKKCWIMYKKKTAILDKKTAFLNMLMHYKFS